MEKENKTKTNRNKKKTVIATAKILSTKLKLKWTRYLPNVYEKSPAQVFFKVHIKVQKEVKLPIQILPWIPANRNSRTKPRCLVSQLWMLWCKWLPSWAYVQTESCMLLLQHKEQLADVFCTEKKPWVVTSVPRSLVLPWVVLQFSNWESH